MRIALNEGMLKGVKVSKRGPQITHLIICNDCVLFIEATDKGLNTLRHILKELCLGQCSN